MIKFGRNYLLKFKIGKMSKPAVGKGINVEWQEEVTISYPLTIRFNVNRSNFNTYDSCSIQILNLNENTRAKLFKDIYEPSKYIEMKFYAGYGDDIESLPLIYYGEVWECYSWKQGAGTDFITDIKCLTGVVGGTYSYSNFSFKKDTEPLDVIKKLCQDIGYPLAGYSAEVIDHITPLKKKTSFSGKSLDILKDFVGYEDGKGKNVVIRNNGIYIIGKNTVIGKEGIEISAESGLLGYPKRRNQYIEIEILFEPRIQNCQRVQLSSSLDDFFNGVWKCVAFTHNGIISGAVNGQCVTSIALFTDKYSFNTAREVKNG